MNSIDYDKVDPWIKKNPSKRYLDFSRANPRIVISSWSFEKRRRLILGLPMSPSMKKDYKPPKTGMSRLKKEGGVHTGICMYSTIWEIPIEEIKQKDPITAVMEMMDRVNKTFNLKIEAVQITPVNSISPVYEFRKYNR